MVTGGWEGARANTPPDAHRSAMAVQHRPLPWSLMNAESDLSVFLCHKIEVPKWGDLYDCYSRSPGVSSPVHFPRIRPYWRKVSIRCVRQGSAQDIRVWGNQGYGPKESSKLQPQEIFGNWERGTNLPALPPFPSP